MNPICKTLETRQGNFRNKTDSGIGGLGGAPGKRRSYRDLPLRNRKGGDGNPPAVDACASALPDAQDCAFLPRLSARVCDSPGRLDSGSGSDTTGMRSNSSATFGRGRIASASACSRTRPASSDSDGSRSRTVAGAGPINLSLLTPGSLLSVFSCSIPAWPE